MGTAEERFLDYTLRIIETKKGIIVQIKIQYY